MDNTKSKRIYLDSNVFISAINREVGFGTRGLFVEAEQFFFRVAERKDVVILSWLFFEEVKSVSFYEKEFVLDFFSKLGIAVEIFYDSKKLNIASFVKAGVHAKDAFHVALALKIKADFIVSFNAKDFLTIERFIRTLLPEEY